MFLAFALLTACSSQPKLVEYMIVDERREEGEPRERILDVDEGTSLTMHTPEEHDHEISIQLTPASMRRRLFHHGAQ